MANTTVYEEMKQTIIRFEYYDERDNKDIERLMQTIENLHYFGLITNKQYTTLKQAIKAKQNA